MMRIGNWLISGAVLALSVMVACGSDDEKNDEGGGTGGGDRSPEQTGDACEVAGDCFPDVDPASLQGDILCMDRVQGGYCTHTCQQDDDCCAVPGECATDLLQVCSPFESTGEKYCFLSCEDEDLVPPPGAEGEPVDPTEFCQREAHPDFICRSSGGGSNNRKVCVPGDQCRDPGVRDAYRDCVATSNEADCVATSGEWLGDVCRCATGEGECACNRASECLASCAAPVPDSGDCADVSEGNCSSVNSPDGCWCVFDDDGVATEQCFD